MSIQINAIGKECPIPVVMTKKEMDHGEENIITIVDNEIAVENLKKLAASMHYSTRIRESKGTFYVTFSLESNSSNTIIYETKKVKKKVKLNYTIFIGKDYIGEGSEELGKNLIRMFLYTLTEQEELPDYILLMNGGVKLAAEDEQTIEHLKLLIQKGVPVLVCGTCLNYYGLTDKLKAGKISNMYEITEKMLEGRKVITF